MKTAPEPQGPQKRPGAVACLTPALAKWTRVPFPRVKLAG